MIIYLEIRSYRGISFGVHYYGELVGPRGENDERKRVDLSKKLSKSAAAKLNRGDRDSFKYKPGDETSRFDTEDEIISLALNTYKEYFPDATILVLGDSYIAEPQKILDGPADIKNKINILEAKAESVDWWDSPEMRNICDEWQQIWEMAKERIAKEIS